MTLAVTMFHAMFLPQSSVRQAMVDENVDLRFLGAQVQGLQGNVRDLQVDVRDLRASEMRRDAEVAGLRADVARIEGVMHAKFEQIDDRFDRLERSIAVRFEQIDDRFNRLEQSIAIRFEQAHQTMATNLQLVLTAISGLKK